MSSRRELLLDWEHAFDQPFCIYLVAGVAAVFVAGFVVITLLTRHAQRAGAARNDLLRGYLAWLALAVALIIPTLLGPGPTIVAIGALSILCYREYARATGLFREKTVSVVVVLTLLAITAAVLDNWHALFVALTPLSIGVLGAVTLLADRPKGYVQRVALGVVGVLLFGSCLAYVSELANHAPYRPLVLWLLTASLVQPILAAATRRLPGPVLLLNTAPGQTLGATLGAILLTTAIAAFAGYFALQGTALEGSLHPLVLGFMVAVVGEMSGLMLAAVRRDLGIVEPANARLLDRVRTLIFVAPVVYFYVSYFGGIAADRPARIFTGG
jgi:phosphatidate cytidylyltransferase